MCRLIACVIHQDQLRGVCFGAETCSIAMGKFAVDAVRPISTLGNGPLQWGMYVASLKDMLRLWSIL